MRKLLFYFCCFSLCFINDAKSINSKTTKTYTNNGNTYSATIEFENRYGGIQYSGNEMGGHQTLNYVVVDNDGNTTHEGFYYESRITYVFNSNEQIIAKKSSWSGDIVETYKYTDSGKVLRYNTNGEFLGAYEDFIDMHMTSQAGSDSYYAANTGISNYIGNKNLTDENGDFKDMDTSGKVLGVYYQNGDYIKNSYNNSGDLISSSKYDKNGNVKESSTNIYDGGGNLVQQYKNGTLIYAKRIYTPAEAAAATYDGNNNTVSITW